LKEAVASAERRVGEALEEVRNEAARKEALEVQQREWERRGKEMENVLRTVRTEILDGEHERDRLLKKAEEAEKAKEQLEGRVVELESQQSAAREAAESGASSAHSSEQGAQSSCDTAKEVQDAVEKVARELHSLYKSKHETKVAALKKSYESRWEKRVRELENKLHKAVAQSERLQNELDTMISSANVGETTMLRESEELEAQKHVLEAKVKGLEQELNAVKRDADMLRSELKHERAEKSELVAVVDEWLAMQEEQAEQDAHMETERSQSPEPPTLKRENILDETADQPTGEHPGTATDESNGAGDTIKAVRHAPAAPMQPPASTNARPRVMPGLTPKMPRFGMPNGHSRTNSGGSISSGIGRLPVPGRSGIMSSIERMGRGGA
jgi:chromosome segregation ATPase